MGSTWKIVLFALAAALSGMAGWVQGGFAPWFVCEALSLALAAAIALRCGALLRVEAEHEPEAARLTEGGEMTVTVRLTHRSLVPVPWLLVEEEWRRNGDERPFTVRTLLFPWFRRTVQYRYFLSGLQRGEYRLESVQAFAGDGLGIGGRRRQAELRSGAAFVAYPLELPLQLRRYGAGDEEGRALPGAPRTAAGGYPAGLRDYAQGDPLASLHWKATARRGTLTVKEAQPHEAQRLAVLLDTSAATYAALGGWAPQALESSVRAAAGLLRAGGERGWALALACCAGGVMDAGSSRERSLLLEQLARVDGKGARRFADVVAGAAATLPAATVLALVTPCVDEPLVAALQRVQRRGRGVLLALPHAAPALAARERERLAALRELGCDVLPLPPQLQPSLAAPAYAAARPASGAASAPGRDAAAARWGSSAAGAPGAAARDNGAVPSAHMADSPPDASADVSVRGRTAAPAAAPSAQGGAAHVRA